MFRIFTFPLQYIVKRKHLNHIFLLSLTFSLLHTHTHTHKHTHTSFKSVDTHVVMSGRMTGPWMCAAKISTFQPFRRTHTHTHTHLHVVMYFLYLWSFTFSQARRTYEMTLHILRNVIEKKKLENYIYSWPSLFSKLRHVRVLA